MGRGKESKAEGKEKEDIWKTILRLDSTKENWGKRTGAVAFWI